MKTLTPAIIAPSTFLRFAWFMVLTPAVGTVAAVMLFFFRGKVEPIAPILFIIFYILTAIGVEVGSHRYFSHRSFKTNPAVRMFLGLCGSAAGQGPVLYWAAVHRNHHRYTDTQRDLHSPFEGGWKGFWRAHIGWMFKIEAVDVTRLVPDLMKDPTTMFVQRTYLATFFSGLFIPGLIGFALGGSIGGLEGFLWGGLMRVFVNHHATWSINSFCHQFGAKPFATRDNSRNLGWLALPTLGGAWHNNHHAFPGSATNDYQWWQLDPSAWLIRFGASLGIIWEVRDGPGDETLARRMSDDRS